ncbi:hypothetical protein CLV43_101182 [Umezawaea tangerina]|uniref:Uncharacterized protein n=1 Tax=Umezawaea tangerina TaxID=84725 RepID=A0A2T0TJM7_9PSEU|nr:hypothetical protein CLV43_101182 [Umezawaea tangerina]
MVLRAEQDHVVVGREESATRELADVALGFTLKCLRDFLRDDAAAEHARKGISDHAFETALEALYEAHGNTFRLG